MLTALWGTLWYVEISIADICEHACSSVFFDTKASATVSGFEYEDDADAFRVSHSPRRGRP